MPATDDRPLPPTPRRLALARRAGLHAASPIVVGAAAACALALGIVALADDAAGELGAWVAAACAGRATLHVGEIVGACARLALPVAVAALVAALAHVVQTRALWLPRRRVPGAPVVEVARVRRAGIGLASALAAAAVAFGWLWWAAPRLAALVDVPLAGAALVASGLAALAIAWVVAGAVDAVVRHAELAASLRMTVRERREDERLSGADPRWRRYRARLGAPAIAVAGATLLLLGDGVAVAIAWDPVLRPIPVRTASGRGARATQLLGLARRHRIPVHRDAALARALDGEGPVPEVRWPALAAIVAALRR